MEIIISPSLLSCDLSNIESETVKVYEAGAKWLHIDVMDGHFVPNLTFGPPVIKCLRGKCPIFFDVHLMVTNPRDYIKAFAGAGADSITFHCESEGEPLETIRLIKSFGIKAGISIKPKTPAAAIFKYLDMVDMVLVMSVEPGFSGQKFIEGSLDKIREIKEEIGSRSLDTIIQADGGVDGETVFRLSKAGVSVFVSGSYVFNNDYKSAIDALIANANRGKYE